LFDQIDISIIQILEWSKTYLDDRNNLVDLSPFVSLIWEINKHEFSSSTKEDDELIDDFLMKLKKFKISDIRLSSKLIMKIVDLYIKHLFLKSLI
jgi:hypothetical protein